MNKESQGGKNRKRRIYRIGIDARFFGLENKGLGRYTSELVEWLDTLSQESIQPSCSRRIKKADQSKSVCRRGKIGKSKVKSHLYLTEYYVFLREDKFNDYQPLSKNIHKVKADYQWYSWKEQLMFPFLLRKHNLDLMHFTHFNVPVLYKFLGIFSGKNRFIVTIHDLILFHYPTVKNTTLNKAFYFFKLSVYHIIIRIVACQAKSVIAISKFTKKDIVKSLKVPRDKVKVIYEGAEFGGKIIVENENAIFKKYGILNEYILYVGNAYPHKNLERLVLAFGRLDIENKDKLQLVLVGKKDYFYEKLEGFVSSHNIKNVVITDYVSDQELEELYKRANLFVFPSLYEGFGLPPLEALVRGLSVVSSDRSSLLEVLGDRVRYFNPKSIRSMKSGIEKVLLGKKLKLTDKEIGEIKNKYSWEKMTREIMGVYEVEVKK